MKTLGTGLALKPQTSLTLSPQLQQSLHLLTLPAAELRQAIEEALEQNPFLIRTDEWEETATTGAEVTHAGATPAAPNDTERVEATVPPAEASESVPDDTPYDAYWEGVTPGIAPEDEPFDPYRTAVAPEGLTEHLTAQAELTLLPETVRQHVLLLIEALDDNGYLCAPLAEIAQWVDPPADTETLEVALKVLQRFDPTGVGARSLSECLLLQLAERPASPERTLAERLVRDALELLAKRDYAGLRKTLGCSEAELKAAIALVESLDPKPGRRFSTETAPTVIPDLIVTPEGDRFRVDLNPAAYPRVVVSPLYQASIGRKSPEAWRTRLAEAKQFVKQLHQRAFTLLRVGQTIVDHQADFFRYGERALQPLTLKTVAEALTLHESTISRVVAGKYLLAPNGLFELKTFFSAALATDDGDATSGAAIKSRIRALIAAEDPHRPLSDTAIADRLAAEGIVIARRTVAKYRDSLSIPPAKLRKRL